MKEFNLECKIITWPQTHVSVITTLLENITPNLPPGKKVIGDSNVNYSRQNKP